MTDRKKPKRPAIYKLDRGESAFGFDPLGPDLMLADEVDAYYGDLLRRAVEALSQEMQMRCHGTVRKRHECLMAEIREALAAIEEAENA